VQSPEGTTEWAWFWPSLRDLFFVPNPALKRRAIVKCPYGTIPPWNRQKLIGGAPSRAHLTFWEVAERLREGSRGLEPAE